MTDRPLSCPDCLDLLDDYRRHTLSPEKSAAVAAHLQQCEQCHAELQAREALAASLRAAFAGEGAPKALPNGVMAALKEHRETNDPITPQRPSPLLPWMLIAAVLLITAVGLVQFKGADLTRQQTIAMQAEPASAPAPVATERTFARSAREAVEVASKDKAVVVPSAEVPAMAPPPAAPPAAEAAGQLAFRAKLPMAAAAPRTNFDQEKKQSRASTQPDQESTDRFYTQPPAEVATMAGEAKAASEAAPQIAQSEFNAPAAGAPAKDEAMALKAPARQLWSSSVPVLSTSDSLLTDTLTSATATSATLTSGTATTGSLP